MAYKVGIISLGCAKNRVDAEMLLYRIRNAGYKLCEDVAMADVAIINTCGFIESAKQESIEEILELSELKKEGKIKAIIVTGCLAERYKEEVMKEIPEADAVVGIGANDDIVKIIDEVLQGKKQQCFPDKLLLPLEGGRIQSTPYYYAYLKIAEGCDNHCTYCAIPMIRGKFRSRKMEDIIAEAKHLAEKGVKELVVVAQDTSLYGKDIYGELMLAKLLKKLCEIDGIRWIRVLYCYPDKITDELLQVMAEEEKIVKYLDLPLQHCNGRVLKTMNRKGNKEELVELIAKIREKVPGIVLRTTFIAGFPTETEEEFAELENFAKEVRFERVGCFAYSQEENTPAAKLEPQIPEDVKERRAEIIMENQQEIMEEFCQKLDGKTIEVLVEGYDQYAECFFGRSAWDAPEVDGSVFFTVTGRKPAPGEFVKVKIDDFLNCDPIGEMVE
ncbi:30S ribosomal protein S12 methylthiotransferase RimO [Anaeromassilibacillus sp. An172]|uniref:30S ribosomal protein S12 methylthiotransferase RimO n=1 Tax=Anaeromassilibacillus sp. An172 TaxID=1965570 RepID=UPI000B392298|nr:30S ribosomal protein S12 methylthiotransferase RimO [Anaeromassilibacillus sp. An172]MEE0763091.1 30S ribosomal protein S12 methylthiotransferase RimO [Acutalibacteraceae bacterium]OUP79704.1 30S ribosomal protein S12 methylthiotransferase RimO [Anaeromassilibacillus sp. An172]